MTDADTTAITAHDAAALALPAPAIEATQRYLQAQVAPATLRAYQSDFALFTAWCASHAGGRGATAFPAAPEVVAAFLAAQADAGVKVATIRRRAAAIHFRHASAQVESPTRQPRGRHRHQGHGRHLTPGGWGSGDEGTRLA